MLAHILDPVITTACQNALVVKKADLMQRILSPQINARLCVKIMSSDWPDDRSVSLSALIYTFRHLDWATIDMLYSCSCAACKIKFVCYDDVKFGK